MKNCKTYAIPFVIIVLQLILHLSATILFAYPVEFSDSSGKKLRIEKRPLRVVSLIPGVTEIIVGIGAGDALKGITYHGTGIPGTSEMEIVGGFFSPDLERIEEIGPDLIFYSSLQKGIQERFAGRSTILINLETFSLRESYNHILLIGEIFNVPKKAEGIAKGIQDELELIHKKVEKIPRGRRKRVIRVMGLDKDAIMTPGDDSFQNEMITAAGGIPPDLKKNGQVVSMGREEWKRFNPQVIYTCGGQREDLLSFLDQPAWRDVEAFQSGKVLDFPCDLTCRGSTHTGYFVSWLAARIYSEDFAGEAAQVTRDGITETRPLDIPVDYVKKAQIFYSNIRDFPNKSLVVDFKRPLSVLSSLEGFRKGIESVGNHYSSPPGWVLNHDVDLPGLRRRILRAINRPDKKTSILFTGADMDNLSVQQASYKEMAVYALVTAGVQSNAVRMSKDTGGFYETGTINIILLTNRRLTQRAMTRALISATEAKSAALQDMDIRSSYSSPVNQATGTGTDNIIVVEGAGQEIDNAGGHSKMGELIARSVYEAVKEAVYKQNGISTQRDVFQRLMERKISVPGLVSLTHCDCGIKKGDLSKALEEIILQPEYASFITSSLALSDDYEKGLVKDLKSYRLWCAAIAEELAQEDIDEMEELVDSDGMPVIIRMSLNAILNGIVQRARQGGRE